MPRRALLTTLVVSPLALAPTAFSASVEVPPGGLVRWPGDARVSACQMEGRRWAPLDETCWYPLDLLHPAGGVELGRVRDGRMETARVEVTEYPYAVQHITLEDPGMVDLSAADLERVEREEARIGQLWDLDTERRFTLPLSAPLQPLPAGGRFGDRRFFNSQPRSPHSGADYSAGPGTPVYAVDDGRVALTGDFFFSGNSVFVDHGDGLISMSFHLSEIAVEPGQKVERGQVVGKVGATGRATGPHLHFALRWRGARVDPALLFDPDKASPVAAAP